MPFGLCNAPGTFQSYINDTVREYLDVFCTAYLDNILSYSDNEDEHIEHVLKILRKSRERGLQLDIDKCEFNTKEVKYLGLVITPNGIKKDPGDKCRYGATVGNPLVRDAVLRASTLQLLHPVNMQVMILLRRKNTSVTLYLRNSFFLQIVSLFFHAG